MAQKKSSLAKIIAEKCGKNETAPRYAYSLYPEVSQIGIKRFAAR